MITVFSILPLIRRIELQSLLHRHSHTQLQSTLFGYTTGRNIEVFQSLESSHQVPQSYAADVRFAKTKDLQLGQRGTLDSAQVLIWHLGMSQVQFLQRLAVLAEGHHGMQTNICVLKIEYLQVLHRFEQRNDAHVRHRASRQVDLLQVAESRKEQYVVVVDTPAGAAVQDFDFGHCGVADAAEELVGVEERLSQWQNRQPLGKVFDGDVSEVDVLCDKCALDDEGS